MKYPDKNPNKIMGNLQKMTSNVMTVSEWLPKEGCEEEAFYELKKLAQQTLANEEGCLQFNVTKQLSHPNALGESKYKIVIIQEYKSIKDFEIHCEAPYISDGFEVHVHNENTAIIEDWQLRVFEKG